MLAFRCMWNRETKQRDAMTLRLRGERVALAWTVGLLALLLGGSVRLAWSQVAMTIPTLPPGKRILVTIDATVNTPLPAGVNQVSTQGSIVGEVGGSPFSLQTDDPNGPGVAPRPTVTALDTVPTPVNHPPQATNDTATTSIRTAVTINVLDNDTDADNDPLTIVRVRQGSNGTVTSTGTTLTYTPARDFIGTDRFRYTVSDGRGGTATARVTVTVTAALVDLLTPQDTQVVAGASVAVAAFIFPEELAAAALTATTLAASVAPQGEVVGLPDDTMTVVFQFRPEGDPAWQDIGTADTPPFFLAPWNTTAVADGVYELRLVAQRATGDTLVSPPIQVTVDNVTPATPPDIVEEPGTKTQQLLVNLRTIVVTSDGVILDVPANAVPADDRVTLNALQPDDAPGIPPGDIVGLLVESILASGTPTLSGPVTVFLPYPDADNDGVVDGTTIAETLLTLWSFDTQAQRWIQIGNARLLPEVNVLVGTVTRLGVLAAVRVQGGTPNPLLGVTLGDESPPPSPPLMISPPITNFAVLQVQVETGAEDVRLTTLELDLTDVHGNEALLQRLRLGVVHDVNANGRADAGETDLASALAPASAAPLRLQFLPPLLLPAATTTHLLVAVTAASGSANAKTVPLSVLPPTVPPWLAIGLGLSMAFSAYLWRRQPHRPLRMVAMLLLCALGCGLVLTSCDGGGDLGEDVLTATVVLPAEGVTGESETSGLVRGPTAPLFGASVIILP